MKSSSRKSLAGSPLSTGPPTARNQRRGSRTTNACEACKRRKTKCSGPPGPCELCEKVNTFCHFDSRLDTRRKSAYKPSAVRERQQYILEGLLQVLKHNEKDNVQEFLHLIRSNAYPEEIAKCLKKNLEILQGQRIIRPFPVDETDLVSLGLQGLFSHRTGRQNAKSGENLPSNVEQVYDEEWDVEDTDIFDTVNDDNKEAEVLWHRDSQEAGNELDLFVNGYTSASGAQSHDTTTNAENSPIFSDSKSENILSSDRSDIGLKYPTKPLALQLETLNQHNDEEGFNKAVEAYRFKQSLHQDLESQEWQKFNIVTNDENLVHHYQSTPSQTLILPISYPRTPLDHMCLVFRDRCLAMLSSGTSFDQLNNFGRMDCELLFRERSSEDEDNIPNWSCEMVRYFPPLLPATRFAAALCLARFLPFLIDPSSSNLAILPNLLRPTNSQLRHHHDVSINFIPIPKLRDCLLESSIDWFTILGEYECRLNWPGVWGDLGGAQLGNSGKWGYNQQHGTIKPHKSESQKTNLGKPQAVVYDHATGRRHISEEYEKSCWSYENWSMSKEILEIWPDLSGHIKLV